MSSSVYMVRAEIDAVALLRFAQSQNINQPHDEDLGYAVHAWLAAGFGTLAPKPFRLLREEWPRLKLLGYSPWNSEALTRHFLGHAPRQAHGVTDFAKLAHAPMPTHWREGRRLHYEVLACPISRQGQAEKDIFLRCVEGNAAEGPALLRENVYREWLAAQLHDSASLDSFLLEGFNLVRILRRTQSRNGGAGRSSPHITRPRALCRGVLTVSDGERFQALLHRGIGRHRAFGFGMLLLKPCR